MAMLHLGVLDIPHVEPTSDKSKAKPTNETTGDLAEILEAKYHVMEIFFQLHGQEIADALASSAEGALESLLMGAPTEQFSLSSADISKSAMSLIEQKFKAFLSNKEMDGLGYPGVPTKAALAGVSHRFKNKQGSPGRPSFIDTGQYQAAFKSWMDS